MLVWNLLCVFSSARFGASLRFTTDLKSSLCPRLTTPFLTPPPPPHLLTRATLLTAVGAEKKKNVLFSHMTTVALIIFSEVGGREGRGVCATFFFLFFFRKKEIMLCAGAGRSWVSAVLGNHLSLYWFRCLSLLVPVTPFVDRPRLWRFEPQAAKKKKRRQLNKNKKETKKKNFTVTFGN